MTGECGICHEVNGLHDLSRFDQTGMKGVFIDEDTCMICTDGHGCHNQPGYLIPVDNDKFQCLCVCHKEKK